MQALFPTLGFRRAASFTCTSIHSTPVGIMLTPQSSRWAYATTLLFSLAAADSPHEHFHSHQRRAQYVGLASGCYSTTPGGLSSQGSFPYQSSAHCGNTCAALNMPVMALSNGNECSCGDLLPAASSKVDDSSCNVPCTGYPGDSCEYTTSHGCSMKC